MKLEDTNDIYQGLLELDRLPKEIKVFNWVVCLILAALFAGYRNDFGQNNVEVSPMKFYFTWLAIISTTCFAVIWLRLTGVKWRHSLLLFIFVPVLFYVFQFIFGMLMFLFYINMGD